MSTKKYQISKTNITQYKFILSHSAEMLTMSCVQFSDESDHR